jgi:hypothetical protein
LDRYQGFRCGVHGLAHGTDHEMQSDLCELCYTEHYISFFLPGLRRAYASLNN